MERHTNMTKKNITITKKVIVPNVTKMTLEELRKWYVEYDNRTRELNRKY